MKRSDRRSSRGKNGDDTGWVRLKLPIATDPGQIQYAVDKTAKRDPRTMSNNHYLLLQASIICSPAHGRSWHLTDLA
jgi:hypothetical protein